MKAALLDTIALSHGTMQCRDPAFSQRFYKEFLGLRSVRRRSGTQYVWLGGDWLIATLHMGEGTTASQGYDNRWGLLVASAEEVDAAHRAAHAEKGKWEIQEITPIRSVDGGRSFSLQDRDDNWWEIYHRPQRLYDDLFEKDAALAS